MDSTLLQSQQNEVLAAIQAVGLNPTEFQWEIVRSPGAEAGALDNLYSGFDSLAMVSELTHMPSGYSFTFDHHNGHFEYWRSPGHGMRNDKGESSDWPEQTLRLAEWANWLREEIDAPNLWEQLYKGEYFERTVPASNASNERFTLDEQTKLGLQLEVLKDYAVKTYKLNQKSSIRVEEGISYLKESSTRMGRKDWFGVAMGVVFGWVFGVVIPPDQARVFIEHFLRALFDPGAGLLK